MKSFGGIESISFIYITIKILRSGLTCITSMWVVAYKCVILHIIPFNKYIETFQVVSVYFIFNGNWCVAY